MMYLWIIVAFLLGIGYSYLPGKKLLFRNIVNRYLIYLGLPLLVFVSISSKDLSSLGSVAIISVLIGLILIVVMYFIVKFIKIKKKEKASLFICSAFGNVAFLGIPVGYLLFGAKGAFIAGVFSFVMMSFRYTLGLYFANRYLSKGILSNDYLKKPFLWILLFVFILTQFNIPVPEFLNSVSMITSYLAVFIVGSSLDFSAFKMDWLKYSFLKLILAPLVIFPVLLLLNIKDPYIFLMLAATPSAFLNTALAIEFGFDDKLASGITTVGTIVFVVFLSIYVLITTT